MSPVRGVIEKVRAALLPHGLFVRGMVSANTHADLMPSPPGDEAVRSIVLIGAIGSSNWSFFREWQRQQADGGGQHPLDAWSKCVITPVAKLFGASVWYPSEPPWQPFQQWAMAAEGLRASPLGILIHPDYGLWHSYRGALGFAFEVDEPTHSDKTHPCEQCLDRPCVSSCPVSAIVEADFQYSKCRTYLKTSEGQGSCMQSGCLARNVCPVGALYRYDVDQLRFHMAALG